MCDRRDADGFIAGAVIGTVIGSVIGILFAPDSGLNTRKRIRRQVDVALEEGSEFRAGVSQKVSEARKMAEPYIEELKEKLAPVVEKLEDVSEPVREQVAEYVSELEEKITGGELPSGGGDADGLKKRFFKGTKP